MYVRKKGLLFARVFRRFAIGLEICFIAKTPGKVFIRENFIIAFHWTLKYCCAKKMFKLPSLAAGNAPTTIFIGETDLLLMKKCIKSFAKFYLQNCLFTIVTQPTICLSIRTSPGQHFVRNKN